MFRIIIWCAAFLVIAAAIPGPVEACTLWVATGPIVKDNGTLIAKNRDNKQIITELKFITREKGFRFIGLFDIEAYGYVVSGINEKGLAVINASAVSVPEEKRNVAKEDLTERLLTYFDSVDSLIKEEAMFAASHPAFYIIADADKVALVEVAPGNKISMKASRDGIFTHTNHYTEEKLLSDNELATPDSRRRLDRVDYLMSTSPLPLTIEQFIAVSEDRGNSPNDSILKVCDKSKKVCTLASWVVYVPKKGFPDLYVKIMRPEQPDTIYRFILDERFWTERFKVKLP
ncbi:MAG: carcinine hydrolase/isopenicillin-N N-acyltransferase family protein [Proteobacteria bacterium]|nr:carcinine hydrolase/isopenicillin-N N-acyltransferase family protein [Pseudomonadota bacterium]